MIIENPDVKFFFGKMTMYPDYNRTARDIVLYFLRKYFPDTETLNDAEAIGDGGILDQPVIPTKGIGCLWADRLGRRSDRGLRADRLRQDHQQCDQNQRTYGA